MSFSRPVGRDGIACSRSEGWKTAADHEPDAQAPQHLPAGQRLHSGTHAIARTSAPAFRDDSLQRRALPFGVQAPFVREHWVVIRSCVWEGTRREIGKGEWEREGGGKRKRGRKERIKEGRCGRDRGANPSSCLFVGVCPCPDRSLTWSRLNCWF